MPRLSLRRALGSRPDPSQLVPTSQSMPMPMPPRQQATPQRAQQPRHRPSSPDTSASTQSDVSTPPPGFAGAWEPTQVAADVKATQPSPFQARAPAQHQPAHRPSPQGTARQPLQAGQSRADQLVAGSADEDSVWNPQVSQQASQGLPSFMPLSSASACSPKGRESTHGDHAAEHASRAPGDGPQVQAGRASSASTAATKADNEAEAAEAAEVQSSQVGLSRSHQPVRADVDAGKATGCSCVTSTAASWSVAEQLTPGARRQEPVCLELCPQA